MSLFGGSNAALAQTPQTVAAGINVQSAVAGQAIPLVYGLNKISGNLIYYGNFRAVESSQSNGAGKGGGGTKGSDTYTYYASFLIGLCEGPINGVNRVWASKSTYEYLDGADLGLELGYVGQAPWSYFLTYDTAEALGYSQTAYVWSFDQNLGSSPNLPNFNFEVAGLQFNTGALGVGDANPAGVMVDLLTNPYCGVGFPGAAMGDFATYSTYVTALGLDISLVVTSQQSCATLLQDIADQTNAAFVWSGGTLSIVPYGDLAIGGYVPLEPLFSLTDDDFIYEAGKDPIEVDRTRPVDQPNALWLEWLNRDNNYNPDLVQARDDAAISLYGYLPDTSKQAHYFCNFNAAQNSALLQLARKAVRNTYTFKVGWRYCVLDPMDIVEITDEALGLFAQPVRILSIDEDDGGVLTLTAEDYLYGTGHSAVYPSEVGSGFLPNYNADAPAPSRPIFIEPTFALTSGAAEVWMGVAGPAGQWGGADVYVSLDNANYTLAASKVQSARYGTLTGPLGDYVGSGLDNADYLDVDLSVSGGSLDVSPGLAAAETGASLAWAGGEFLAYATTMLTEQARYRLTGLARGLYDTLPQGAPAGAAFLRCDDSVVKLPVTAAAIGRPVYVKVLGRNAYGGGQPSLGEVPAYIYTYQGLAYTAPLPQITDLSTVYQGNILRLAWTAVEDTRQPIYEIRQGPTWRLAQIIATIAVPGLAIGGNGTYWVAAKYTAPNGLAVYGAASDVTVAGAIIARNAFQSFDEAATGWTGICDGTLVSGGHLMLDGAGSVLAETDFLNVPNLLAYGAINLTGTYTVPAAHRVNAGRVLDALVTMSWQAAAQSIYDNVLTINDFLSVGDLLETDNGPLVRVTPQIQIADASGAYGPWQDFTPGQYEAQHFNFRLVLATTDPTINCVASGFTIATDVPDRLDTGTGLAVGTGGATVAFTTSFNAKPNVQVTIIGAAPGDTPVITGRSVAGFTVTIMNGASAVARTIDWAAQGI